MAFLKFTNLTNAILSALALNFLILPITAAADSPKEYIVVLKDDVDSVAVAVEQAITYAFNVDFTYQHALKGYTALLPEPILSVLRNDPRVSFISEDRPVKITDQTPPTGVQRIQSNLSRATGYSKTNSVNVGVAIIDTGISTSHPDLNVIGGKSCLLFSFLGNYDDGNGHGTHVAGTIAAKNNKTNGVVGVIPGAPLYAVRVLNSDGSGTTSSVICGIDWVTENAANKGIKVANMSLGGTGSDDGNCGKTNNDAMHQAICNSVAAGVTYVVAAGNDSQNLANDTPAGYKEVLTVTAMADFNGKPGGGAAPTCRSDVDDTAADFSNFTTIGSSDVAHTIAAPGVCITSTWLNSGYKTISGTSMASPHVAGTVALCIASGSCAGKTPQEIIIKLRSDAAAQPKSYGFQDDPNFPNGNRYYGNLVYAGGY